MSHSGIAGAYKISFAMSADVSFFACYVALRSIFKFGQQWQLLLCR